MVTRVLAGIFSGKGEFTETVTRISDYIELDRKFVVFEERSQAEEPDDLLFARSALLGTEKSWAGILHNPCTVVLAEARAGKTTELCTQAEKLRNDDKEAFFCRLDMLADRSLEDSLEIGTRQQFRAWAKSDAPGYFFLDAVDEARLTSWGDFEKAVRNFVDAVESYKARLTVVISTRPNAWQAQADRAMLKRWLSFPEEVESVGNGAHGSAFNRDGRSLVPENEANLTVTRESSSPIAIVQMVSLNQSQVRIFAEAKGMTDIDGFLEAIEHADADSFATRPADLRGLIDSWKEHGRLGSYAEIVARAVAGKLADENLKHSDQSPISADRVREGARILAAAVTLTKRPSILLPDEHIDETLRSRCLDPEQVLPDWTPGEIRALLSRGLFDPALYGSVRFHHRTVREYLAAQLVEKLLLEKANRRRIERLFFVRPYGDLPEVVVPALKPILGWLAAWDEPIRDCAVRIDPKVLLEYGDPSALDTGTRATLLRDFARHYEDRQHTPLILYSREVRRVADHRLARVIRELLETYRDHVDVRRLLLRVIREGQIPDCGHLAYTFATNTQVDVYARVVAVHIVGLTGIPDEKRRLAEEILGQVSSLDPQILGAALEALWPEALTDRDVVTLLEKVPPPDKFKAPSLLKRAVSSILEQLTDSNRVHTFLSAVLAIVSRPPVHDEWFCRISKQYEWLLHLLWTLVERVYCVHHAPETLPDFLEAMALCGQSSRVSQYTGSVNNERRQLLHDNAKIRHALFWHEYARAQKLRDESFIGLWFLHASGLREVLSAQDSEVYLQDLRERADPEEKRIAMSVLFNLCGASDNTDLLGRIRDVVSGDSALEAEIDRHLAPPVPPKEQLEMARINLEKASQSLQRERTETQARQDWIEKLKADPTQVGDLSLAEKGEVWNNTCWLLQEIEEKTHSGDRLTVSHWELLIPDFGEAVAQQFRDFCRAFWKRYIPSVQPDDPEGKRTIPPAFQIGLSGLAMEAASSETWADRLTDNEAELATRYALGELNDFPGWFQALLQAKSESVRRVLREEIAWEFSTSLPDGASHYVLERLRGTRLRVTDVLRDDTAEILATTTDVPVNPLRNALAIILRTATPVSQVFQDVVARQAEAASSEQHKVIWLAALLCLNAERALDLMAPWVNAGTTQDGERRVSLIINHLWGRSAESFNSEQRSYEQLDCLSRLLEIVYSYVRPEDDIQHSGVYSPGSRDNAQDAREHLLQLLCEIPGKPACDALIRLSGSPPLASFKDRLLNLAERRAEADADFKAWSPEQVAEFIRDAEWSPETQQDLFAIALSRLDDIKLDLEEGDDSDASLWRKVDDEIELRRVIANRLRLISRNKYTTGSEEELADRSRTDIRLHNPKVDARIPIEIKIAGKWSANKLRERMETQLVGQYLREARFGIFLLVNRRAGSDRRSWRPGDKNLDFSALVQWLKGESGSVLQANPRLQKIEVLGIDLTKRIAAGRRCFTEAYETFAREADLSALALDPDEVFGTVRDTIPGRDVEL